MEACNSFVLYLHVTPFILALILFFIPLSPLLSLFTLPPCCAFLPLSPPCTQYSPFSHLAALLPPSFSFFLTSFPSRPSLFTTCPSLQALSTHFSNLSNLPHSSRLSLHFHPSSSLSSLPFTPSSSPPSISWLSPSFHLPSRLCIFFSHAILTPFPSSPYSSSSHPLLNHPSFLPSSREYGASENLNSFTVPNFNVSRP